MNTSVKNLFTDLGIANVLTGQDELRSYSPIDGKLLGGVAVDSSENINEKIAQSVTAFKQWREIPAPQRGELIRQFGNLLREHKEVLGELVTLECGKIMQEGLGEVQEMIDICDFAVGLSRQLYGLTIASERPQHKMLETWHPMGPVAIISAFNFPVAVWAWNAALAIVCGNSILWKPSEKTPLTAVVCQKLFEKACTQFGKAPKHLSQVIHGDGKAGAALVNDKRIPIISATGSTAMGAKVGQQVAARFGRSILELGGNNGLIVCPTADLNLAKQAIVFGAVGTAGQRCTSTRRLFVHESIYDDLYSQLKTIYKKIPVGNPLDEKTLVGPLIDEPAYAQMQMALERAKKAGFDITGGDRVPVAGGNSFYVNPALVEVTDKAYDLSEEVFAPILYVQKYSSLDEVIEQHNNVPQGLSSAIFSNDIRETEQFLSAAGSDCGIANVNIGTSGAEIGGAFGGEKATGGGRESGSDAWKGYMRRATSTINYSRTLPLAQGIQFNLD